MSNFFFNIHKNNLKIFLFFLILIAIPFNSYSESRYVPKLCEGNYKENYQKWNDCLGTLILANGDTYVGEFQNGTAQGEGTYTFADGKRYIGEFKDGKIHGKGTMTFPDGSKKEVEYNQGELRSNNDNRVSGKKSLSRGQIFKIWIFIAIGIYIIFFIGAYTNKITVYRDPQDMGWSLCLILSPCIGYLILAVVADYDDSVSDIATQTTFGLIITILSLGGTLLSIFKTFQKSIQDNGQLMGLIVGTGKVLLAIFIAFFALSLISYLFKDKRRLGHIAIFFMIFGLLGWIVKVLINGEKTGAITNNYKS